MRLGTLASTHSSLTYADPTAPLRERAFVNIVELLGGRATLARLYEQWRTQWPLSGLSLWSSALYWLGVSLKTEGAPWPLPVDFSETEAALRNNIAARRRALDAPRAGGDHRHLPGRRRLDRAADIADQALRACR